MDTRTMMMMLFIFSLSLYCALSISRRLIALSLSPKLFLTLFCIGFLILVCGPLFSWVLPRSYPDLPINKMLSDCLNELGWLFFGLYSCIVALVLISDLLEILTSPIHYFISRSIQYRRYYHLLSLVGITLIASAVLIIGRYNAKSPKIYPVTIEINNLSPLFDGYQIVQISDLHTSSMIQRKHVANVVAIANAQQADLIVLTGDLVDGTVENLGEDLQPLNDLSAPDGVLGVTGNHEYYSGVAPWLQFYKSINLKIMNNEHITLNRTHNNQSGQLVIAGVPDYGAMRHQNPLVAASDLPHIDIEKTFMEAPENAPRILLAHTPDTYILLTNAKVDLMLSGHTHRGQYFPFTAVIQFFQTYYEGLYQVQLGNPSLTTPWPLQIYVNRGTAFWGPPLRTWQRPEITLITLKAKK